MTQELVKGLHVDLTGDAEFALETLHLELQHVERLAKPTEELGMTLANGHVRTLKLAELQRSDNVVPIQRRDGSAQARSPYKIAGFMPGYTGNALAADAVAERLLGSHFAREGERRIAEFPVGNRVTYNDHGKIGMSTDPAPVGLDAFHYLSALAEEEVALVLCDNGKLVYAADISRFEKTPKTATGENPFLGRDLLEFHQHLPGVGALVTKILRKTADAMSNGSLDMLTVDLRGRGVYTTGQTLVRRFERDVLVPLRDDGLQGILGYADVQFQEVNETRSPFEGGTPGFRPLIQTQLEVHDG